MAWDQNWTLALIDLNWTLALIKPDARPHTDEIIGMIDTAGFTIIAKKEILMRSRQVETFYGEHRDRPWFQELVSYMTSAVTTALVLESVPGALEPRACWYKWRDTIGHTDPKRAERGTIRSYFASEYNLPRNVVHGSDSEEAARREIAFFFAGMDLVKK